MSDGSVIQFRTAFHGFNREDVVAYIDSMTSKHQSELRSLQDENMQLRSALEQAESKIAASTQSGEFLEDLNKKLREAQTESSGLRIQIKELEQRALEAKTAAPAAAPIVGGVYAAEPKRDYSEMELAAYRRAEVMERLARDRSQTVYRQVQSVFSNGSSKLEIGQNDLEQLTKTLEMDVSQLLQLLAKLRGAYSETEESFRAIGDQSNQFAESV